MQLNLLFKYTNVDRSIECMDMYAELCVCTIAWSLHKELALTRRAHCIGRSTRARPRKESTRCQNMIGVSCL